MKPKTVFKKWVHTNTALVFLFQQVSPAFAMEALEEKRDFSVLRTVPASSSQTTPLSEELTTAQQTLQTLILESTHARSDPFTPLLAEIRQELEASSPEVRELIKGKLPNLLEGALSLFPHALLRLKDRIPFDPTLAPNHAAFKRLQEVMGFLEGFYQNPLLTSSPLKSKLQKLQTHYREYMNFLCRIAPPERLPYLSAIPFVTEFLEAPYVVSKEIAYDLLSLNEYGLITKTNETGSSPVAKVGQVYVKKNLTKSRINSSDTSPDSSVQEGTLNPAMEWGMSTFHRLLFGEGLVKSSLVLLPSVPHKDPIPGTEGEQIIQEASDPSISKKNRDTIINRLHEEEELQRDFRSTTKSYMAQATEEAKGEFLSTFLERALQDPSLFESLDYAQVQGVILSSFLLAFGDAKGDNLMVTFPDAQGKRKIISIDNDWALESFILEERPGYHVLGVRNLLFFISKFMNQSLDPQVRERFLSYNPGVFLLRWLRALLYHNERYEALGRFYPQALLETDPQRSLHLKLKPGTAKEILERFTHLQHVLHLNSKVKLQELFTALSPLASLYCQDLVNQEKGPLKAFDKAYNRQAFFEDVLRPKLSQVHKGVTFQETLSKETTPLNAYKSRTQSLLEAVQEGLDSIDFQALTPQEGLQTLEEAAAYFPGILKRSIQRNESLVGSFTLKKFAEHLKNATENNDPEAQFQLGGIYAYGQGVKQNMERAREWCEKAIQNDHPIGKKVLQLIENQKNKEELDLSNKNLTFAEIKFLMILLKDRSLKKLNLQASNIGDEGVKVLSDVLRDNTSLQELNLQRSNIGAEGARFLSEVLRDNTTLQRLDLYDNNIGDKGVKFFSEGLRNNTTLQKLNLSWNKIGTGGARFLSEFLKSNTSLQELDLSFNNIGDEGVRFLSEVLRNNTSLTSLSLEHNNIGAEGAHFLSEVLRGNTSLQELDLSINNIGNEGAKALGEFLKGNTTLQVLKLGVNCIGAEGKRSLGELKKQSPQMEIRYTEIDIKEPLLFKKEDEKNNKELVIQREAELQKQIAAEEAQRRHAIPQIAWGHEDVYERFLKGKLIYKPNKDNDIGKIELRIADLPNPLEGEFDLSKCGDAARYLSINTGYRKGRTLKNTDKVEIWFAPRFLIENNLAGSASHFERIMYFWDARTAPVGMFFTYGGWRNKDWYDYATTLNWEAYNDVENNLRKLYSLTRLGNALHAQSNLSSPAAQIFHVIFELKEETKQILSVLEEPLLKARNTEQEDRKVQEQLRLQKEQEEQRQVQIEAEEQRKKATELEKRRQAIPQIAWGHEDVYESFLKGKLIYKPNKENDVGKIELHIADLANPLEGEFDLSKCGDASKYLSINTGYRKGKRPENANKVEIWFAPHFLIEKNLGGTASHFKDIMGSWDASTAPVGTFFTYGNWDDLGWYEYATKLSWESYDDTENNLRNIWARIPPPITNVGRVRFSHSAYARVRALLFFMSFSLNPKEETKPGLSVFEEPLLKARNTEQEDRKVQEQLRLQKEQEEQRQAQRAAEEEQRRRAIPQIALGHEDIYERFLRGRLIYKPNKDNDVGRIELRIADLPNPLEGEFDLSSCGNAGKYLSINTGYRKGKRPENKDKLEIWFSPHFLIEKNLAGSASHFKDIMGSWDASTAPVGTFFTRGNWDTLGWYDYATKMSWEDYNYVENNIKMLHCDARSRVNAHASAWAWPIPRYGRSRFFMSFLMNPKEETKPGLSVFEEPLLKAPKAEDKDRKIQEQFHLQKEEQRRRAIPQIAWGHEDVYERFLRGKLIYKPNKDNDVRRIELRIADLANPLEGEFDLSKCGDAAQYLSINTGYRKGKRPENKDKVEIWFAPRFLIEKNLQGSASHFKPIIGSWDASTAPVGMFFTYGDDNLDWYAYATKQTWESYKDPENNLRNIWCDRFATSNSPSLHNYRISTGLCRIPTMGSHHFPGLFYMSFLMNPKEEINPRFSVLEEPSTSPHKVEEEDRKVQEQFHLQKEQEEQRQVQIEAEEKRKKATELEKRRRAIPKIALGHEDVYERFLRGRLIYKPNKDNDIGRIELRIADLSNPLEGEFDLSKCGDTSKYLSINTGYRKGIRPENARKVEIWFAPHFLIEKNLSGSASHFKDIMGSWDDRTAPVGTFFTYGGWDNLGWYDYIVNENFYQISDGKNLYEKHVPALSQSTLPHSYLLPFQFTRYSSNAGVMEKIFVSFLNSNED